MLRFDLGKEGKLAAATCEEDEDGEEETGGGYVWEHLEGGE